MILDIRYLRYFATSASILTCPNEIDVAEGLETGDLITEFQAIVSHCSHRISHRRSRTLGRPKLDRLRCLGWAGVRGAHAPHLLMLSGEPQGHRGVYPAAVSVTSGPAPLSQAAKCWPSPRRAASASARPLAMLSCLTTLDRLSSSGRPRDRLRRCQLTRHIYSSSIQVYWCPSRACEARRTDEGAWSRLLDCRYSLDMAHSGNRRETRIEDLPGVGMVMFQVTYMVLANGTRQFEMLDIARTMNPDRALTDGERELLKQRSNLL